MKAAVDTSSLISLVRYYLPFDKQAVLFDLFQKKIQNKEIVLLDKIGDECRNTSKGIVFTSLPFLADKEFLKKYHPFINTEALLPPSPTKFFNQLDNTFINGVMKNKLTSVEYEVVKNEFLNSADAKLIIYCLKHMTEHKDEKIILVTEETEVANDKKVFQKIPAICKYLEIEVKTLPELLELYGDEVNLQFK